MIKLLSKIALAGALAMAPLAAQAQAPVLGVGVADVDKAVADVTAFQTARAQLQTQYKPQLAAFTAKQQAAQAELQGLQGEVQTLQRSNAPAATVQSKVSAFQARQTALQSELASLSAPFSRQFAFTSAQVEEKLDAAVRAAMTARHVGLLVNPQALVAVSPTNDITADITTQLNTTVRTVSITPPANWQPGQPTSATAPTGR